MISRQLKIIAKELNIPVIALSQLNRGVESRPDKKPMLSDLRESGSIEQDADQVLFLFRPEYYANSDQDPTAAPAANVAEVIVAKNRHGDCRTVELAWAGEFTQFTSLEQTPY